MGLPTSLIALTTDFGASFYVGQIKGVLAGLAPRVPVIDLTHEIQPQDVLGGAVVLQDSFLHFPPGTIHLAVVDPGVGTQRSIVAVQLHNQWIIGPDNGLLSGVLRLAAPTQMFRVTNSKLWRESVSHTFHGRDIMAPVAAHLACGGAPELIGERIECLDIELIPRVEFVVSKVGEKTILGQTLMADRYGNLLSNILASDLHLHFLPRPAEVRSMSHLKREVTIPNDLLCVRIQQDPLDCGKTKIRWVSTYGEAKKGELVGLLGSAGRLEISLVNGSAAEKLRGTKFSLIVSRDGKG